MSLTLRYTYNVACLCCGSTLSGVKVLEIGRRGEEGLPAGETGHRGEEIWTAVEIGRRG